MEQFLWPSLCFVQVVRNLQVPFFFHLVSVQVCSQSKVTTFFMGRQTPPGQRLQVSDLWNDPIVSVRCVIKGDSGLIYIFLHPYNVPEEDTTTQHPPDGWIINKSPSLSIWCYPKERGFLGIRLTVYAVVSGMGGFGWWWGLGRAIMLREDLSYLHITLTGGLDSLCWLSVPSLREKRLWVNGSSSGLQPSVGRFSL